MQHSGSLTWSVNGEPHSSISFQTNTTDMNFPYIRVFYSNTNSEEKFDYKIPLTYTTPHYGGKRWWFQCPIKGCGKRVGVLYIGGKYFGCRHCHNLAYPSQNENLSHRHFERKADKLQKKLLVLKGHYVKPKGMHSKTFEKIFSDMAFYRQVSNQMLYEQMLHILKL